MVTETMLVRGVNDQPEEIEKIADFLAARKPWKSYVAIPIRPPAEARVNPPDESAVNLAFQIFREKSVDTEYLIGYEGNAFAFTGNAEADLLSITSVHPMREDAVDEFLIKAGADRKLIDRLVKENKLAETRYKDKLFYLRKWAG